MKRILVSAIIAAASINAYAESNVTLYGVIDQAVAVTKHKHEAAKVRIDDGIYAGSRFGIKGTEDRQRQLRRIYPGTRLLRRLR